MFGGIKRVPNVIQKTKHHIVLHIIKSKWYKLGGKLRLTKPLVCVPHPTKAQMTITIDNIKLVDTNMIGLAVSKINAFFATRWNWSLHKNTLNDYSIVSRLINIKNKSFQIEEGVLSI